MTVILKTISSELQTETEYIYICSCTFSDTIHCGYVNADRSEAQRLLCSLVFERRQTHRDRRGALHSARLPELEDLLRGAQAPANDQPTERDLGGLGRPKGRRNQAGHRPLRDRDHVRLLPRPPHPAQRQRVADARGRPGLHSQQLRLLPLLGDDLGERVAVPHHRQLLGELLHLLLHESTVSKSAHRHSEKGGTISSLSKK